MPKFLIEASYTLEGVKGLRSAGGSSRRDAVAHALESAGGSLEHFYFAFGDTDAYVIVDLPDAESAAAVAPDRQLRGRRHHQDRAAADARGGRRGSPALGRVPAARRL